MEFVNSVISFVLGPYGTAIVALLLFLASEWMALNPNIASNGIFQAAFKALGWIKEKQVGPKV